MAKPPFLTCEFAIVKAYPVGGLLEWPAGNGSAGPIPMIIIRKSILALLLTAIMTINVQTHADDKGFAPDLLIINANVQTMDPRQPAAQAVAVAGTPIVALGTTKNLRKLAGARTRIIDAHGQLLLPGFN